MAALESMAVKTPVVVQGECELLKDHSRESRAGLWFHGCREFAEGISLLKQDDFLRIRMGENGRDYVLSHYSWNTIMEKYRKVAECMEVDSI
jgi:glycosyltransferase involved in cell wall biosynthesis